MAERREQEKDPEAREDRETEDRQKKRRRGEDKSWPPAGIEHK